MNGPTRRTVLGCIVLGTSLIAASWGAIAQAGEKLKVAAIS